MNGSNSNMSLIVNVAEDLDGTDPSLSPYTWTCPDVDPYSTIYFYQFTSAADKSSAAWTTRFTVRTPILETKATPELVTQITSPAGEATVPPHAKQPNGDAIPWGIGALRSGPSVASREKYHGSSSTEETDSDENYDSSEDEETGQRSSSSKVKGGTDYDDEVSTTETSVRKGGSASSGTSGDDSEDSDISEDDETTSGTKSGSSESTLKDTEENSGDPDPAGSKISGTQGSDDSLISAEDEESEPEGIVSTSSRLKTVYSKPTSTPFNINAATPTLPLPSTPSSSVQSVGCAGGINATSSYCSAPGSINYATYASELDSKAFVVAVLVCSFGLLQLE